MCPKLLPHTVPVLFMQFMGELEELKPNTTTITVNNETIGLVVEVMATILAAKEYMKTAKAATSKIVKVIISPYFHNIHFILLQLWG